MSTKEELLRSAANCDYWKLSPSALDALRKKSINFLVSHMNSLGEQELFPLLEQQTYVALLTGNDSEAKLSLRRLSDRFGLGTDRVSLLNAMYIEVTQGPESSKKYLSLRAANDLLAAKRSLVFLKQKGQSKAYVEELLRYLDMCATDSEAWTELAETYVTLGLFPQAIHALEEVVLLLPTAYNAFARLGEVFVIDGSTTTISDGVAQIELALKQFLRAVELHSDYVRGWAGVYTTASKLEGVSKLDSAAKAKYGKLSALASKRLQEIAATGPADAAAEAKLVLAGHKA